MPEEFAELLATVQSFGNIIASGVAGLLWTVFSPTIAFVYLAAWAGLACVVLTEIALLPRFSQASKRQ